MEATKPAKCQEGTFPCVLTWLSRGVSVCSAGIVSMTSKKSGLGLQTVSKHPHKASSHYHGSPTSGAQGYFYGSKTLTCAPPAASTRKTVLASHRNRQLYTNSSLGKRGQTSSSQHSALQGHQQIDPLGVGRLRSRD